MVLSQNPFAVDQDVERIAKTFPHPFGLSVGKQIEHSSTELSPRYSPDPLHSGQSALSHGFGMALCPRFGRSMAYFSRTSDAVATLDTPGSLSLIHISEPTRPY